MILKSHQHWWVSSVSLICFNGLGYLYLKPLYRLILPWMKFCGFKRKVLQMVMFLPSLKLSKEPMKMDCRCNLWTMLNNNIPFSIVTRALCKRVNFLLDVPPYMSQMTCIFLSTYSMSLFEACSMCWCLLRLLGELLLVGEDFTQLPIKDLFWWCWRLFQGLIYCPTCRYLKVD